MKKNVLIVLLIPFLLVGCKNRDKNPQTDPSAVSVVGTVQGQGQSQSASLSEDSQISMEDLSGKVIYLSSSEFKQKITDIDNPKGFQYKGMTPCIVDFYADWCAPCQGLNPLMRKIANEHKGELIIYKVNVDKSQDLCNALKINSIPTLFFFKRNSQPHKIVGAPTTAELKSTVEKFLNE